MQRRLPPFFSNLLPERDGVLRDYLAQRAGISPEREFPLLWLVGADLPGAVIAVDSEGQPLPPPEEKLETREANKDEVLRFSLAGVQLKFSAIGRGGKQLRIPAQGRDGQWIVKLPSPRFPKVPENEFAMMTLAREVGIDVPEFGLGPTSSTFGSWRMGSPTSARRSESRKRVLGKRPAPAGVPPSAPFGNGLRDGILTDRFESSCDSPPPACAHYLNGGPESLDSAANGLIKVHGGSADEDLAGRIEFSGNPAMLPSVWQSLVRSAAQ